VSGRHTGDNRCESTALRKQQLTEHSLPDLGHDGLYTNDKSERQ
jgi:hypothetical protein